MVREDYVFRQPNGERGIYEEFHTGRAVFYSISEESKTSMLAFGASEIPLFARVLANYEKLPIKYKGELDCFEIFLGPIEVTLSDLRETLQERAHMQRSLQQCDAGKHKSMEETYLNLGDAIEKYADAFESQGQFHYQRTYNDIPSQDFRAYFRSFLLKPLNYSETQKGKVELLVDFERFMETYPVSDHVKIFCEEAYKNPRSHILTYYSRIFEDIKKEKYERVSDRLKKISSRLQSV